MKKLILYITVLFSGFAFSQETLPELLNKYNTKSIPYITVQELAMPKTNAILLDAREQKEYDTSHIKGAIYVGYDFYNFEAISDTLQDKNQEIVVYCSLGIRSEDIAEKLKAEGFTNVKNLYGGIFEWKNKDFKVYDLEEKETENVHTFNEEWSKWLLKGIKIYE